MELILAKFWLMHISGSDECKSQEMSLKERDYVHFFFLLAGA